MTKMRYKQGKGDPAGFKMFMRQENIKPSMIVRYVGNRFHVLFHLAGVLYLLRDKLMMYLENVCHNTTLRTALIQDLKNRTIILELRALGLIGKLVTGPWMKHFYASQHMTNLDIVPAINMCMNNLNLLRANPSIALIIKTDIFIFGSILDDESVLKHLQESSFSSAEHETFNEIFALLLQGVIDVINKQMDDYLRGELATLSPSKCCQSKSAPVHNMFSEQTLGLADHQLRRAHNAKIGFIDGKVKATKNKTMSWLSTKSSAEQSKIISFSTKRACKMKIIQHQREETLKRVQDERHKEKHQKIDQRERRKVEKKMASVFNEKSTLNDEFPEITQEQKTFISRAFTDLNSLLGIYLNHRWYENFTNVIYIGHVVTISHKAKLPKLTITYWTIDESEEEGIDNTITVIEMLVDYLNGDLVFVEDGNDVLQY